jgi:hypothetical protein
VTRVLYKLNALGIVMVFSPAVFGLLGLDRILDGDGGGVVSVSTEIPLPLVVFWSIVK